MYINYHKHSYYSNVITPDSPVSPKDYANRVIELGQTVLSGLEHGYMGRYIEYYELAKENNLKLLLGTEAYFVKNRTEKDKTNAHLILLAKSELGRKGINKVISEANVSGFYYRPRLDLDLLFTLPKNDVWITTACVAGLWKYPDADDLVLQMFNYFGDNFFLEVQNHFTQSQIDLNKHILELSEKNNIQTIWGCDSHFIYPEQSKERDNYLLSKHVVYEDEVGWYMDFPSEQTSKERFVQQGVLTNDQIDKAIQNTNIFSEVLPYDSVVFQKNVKLPTIFPDKTQDEKDILFKDLIWKQWEIEKQNVGETHWKKYETEIQKELDVILETKMADYFLLDYEVVKKGKEMGGHITMTGRGSAPSFYVCKLLGLTTVDRISATVKLYPERFATKERILEAGSLPDIDLNLGNPEVFLQAQEDIVGKDHSYPMLMYGTLHPKAAFKLYARAKNIDFETANMISGQIDKYDMDRKHLEEDEKDSISAVDYIDEEYKEIFLESEIYQGIVAQASIHPCASLILSGYNISEEIGLIKVKENLVTVMDGLWAENYKFLKNDLLKVSVVDLIYKIYERIGIQPHSLPELIKLCHNNEKVWEVYSNAWVMGINQVEQTSTSGRVAKYKPQNISELSAFIAAIRPGFKSNYKQFEAREPFSYGIESLDKIIQTKEFPQSYMLYQENAMQVMAYAGIPISQTYEIVKNIAKKRVEKVLKYKDQFIQGMTKKVVKSENRTPEEATAIADMTWKIIENSSRYSFNSSHAYCYAGDSLYGAYLKSHYPLQFYEVFMNLMEESGDKDRLIEAKDEAQRAFKIRFLPFKFGQDNRAIVAKPDTNEIMSSLNSIKGFGAEIGNNLYELGQKTYATFLSFLIDAEENDKMSSKFEDLIRINYFEQFGNNQKLLSMFEEFTKGKSRYSKTHTTKTKEKRIIELKSLWESLPNTGLPVLQQIESERDILGYVQVRYPKIDKKFCFVLNLDIKYAPRVELYCLNNGKRESVKIYKKTYMKNMFGGGEILKCISFNKKNAIKYMNGGYLEDEDAPKVWWLDEYRIIKPSEFNLILEGKIVL
jgi:DNA polymerase III alpha subunit